MHFASHNESLQDPLEVGVYLAILIPFCLENELIVIISVVQFLTFTAILALVPLFVYILNNLILDAFLAINLATVYTHDRILSNKTIAQFLA